MKLSLFLKGTTLLFFISLLTGFLFYRSGKFEKYFLKKSDPAINSFHSVADNSAFEFTYDTVPVSNDSVEKLRMFSSKSMVLTERKIKYKKPDSVKKKKEKTILSSSKSGVPFRVEDIQLSYDSTRFDTIHMPPLKSKKQKKQ